MSMKTFDELKQQWNSCHGQGQVLVDANHPLRMYLNINSKGNKEILIPITRWEKRFKSTAAIGISNYESKSNKYFAVELLQPQLEAEYVCLCFDLIESSRHCSSSSDARRVLFDSLKKWFYLLAESKHDILPENEIRGLLGELKYMLWEIDSGKEDITVIDAWKIHKDSSRDFIFDDTWSEVKTAESTKDYVTISSIEQLDHDSPGTLIVYKLDKTSETDPSGVSLNDMVELLRNKIGFQAESLLNQKLLSKGYVFNEQYDSILFLIKGCNHYKIDNSFPQIKRNALSSAILRAQYDLQLAQIERWRINHG